MAATIQIHELTTNATTGVDKTSGTVRFKNVASTTSTAVDSSDPLVVPGSGTNYSYVKKLRAKMTAAPGTNVSNLKWYSDGSSGLGTGIAVTAKNIGTTFGTHYNTAMTGGTNLFTYTSGAALDGVTTDTGPFLPASNGSYIGDIIELQLSVASTATNGALSAESVVLAYDEI